MLDSRLGRTRNEERSELRRKRWEESDLMIYNDRGFYSVVQIFANKCLHVEKVF
jgi:hypothetical protein